MTNQRKKYHRHHYKQQTNIVVIHPGQSLTIGALNFKKSRLIFPFPTVPVLYGWSKCENWQNVRILHFFFLRLFSKWLPPGVLAEFGESDCCPKSSPKINFGPGIDCVIVVICYVLLFASFLAFFRFIFIVKYTFEHRTNVVFTFRSRL